MSDYNRLVGNDRLYGEEERANKLESEVHDKEK
jgi:hypothetical protein